MGKDDKERKMLAKQMENPEEKRKRRLEKKERKEAKRKRDESTDLMGYTNDSNPFGDSNLAEKFVWKLKQDKEEKLGVVRDPREESRRKDEIRKEIEKVKKRREERELEKAQWEEEKARLQREQDAQSFQDWEAKEDEFYLKQAKMAADIRIKQGRAKPIDILYKNLSMDSDFDFEVNEPYLIFNGLNVPQLEELKKDIRVYIELDSHKEFWSSLSIVCDDELDAARKRDALGKAKTKSDIMRYTSNTGMHDSISSDIHDIFNGKTSKELDELQASITQQIESGAALDVEYWETLLKKLTVFKAKAKLKEMHADMLRQKLSELETRKEDMNEGDAKTTTAPAPKQTEPEKAKPAAAEPATAEPATKTAEKPGSAEPAKKPAESVKNPAESAKKPAQKAQWEEDEVHTYMDYEEEVVESSGTHRRQLLKSEAKKLLVHMDAKDRKENRQLTEEEMYRQEAAIAMEEEEEEFSGDMELPVDNKVYSMNDKFRPRKPRFFNRVHTGYEWNKYNQTHYDHDNPPPKVVQGYKFNLFYPDLLDKAQAPVYKILTGTDPDTCTLLIHAGPPYEDIAFKIVNREWEYSHKKGFKCTFERGILHLWFNFKKYRYRR